MDRMRQEKLKDYKSIDTQIAKKQDDLRKDVQENPYGFTQSEQNWLLAYEEKMSKLDKSIAKVNSHLKWKNLPQDDKNLLENKSIQLNNEKHNINNDEHYQEVNDKYRKYKKWCKYNDTWE